MAARYAAERHGPNDIKRINAALAEQRRAKSTRGTYEAIRRFHLAVVDTAGNPLIARFASSLWSERIGLHVFLRQANRAALDADVDEHKLIVEAIDRRDGDRAEQPMHDHIADSLERLLGFQGESAQRKGPGAAAEA